MKLTDQIAEWLRMKTFLDIAKIEQIGLRLPPTTRPLNRAMKGYCSLPEKYVEELLPILCGYGFYLMVEGKRMPVGYNYEYNRYIYNKMWVDDVAELAKAAGMDYGKTPDKTPDKTGNLI